MNGVLNFSVKDGWWYEGYVEGAGWALTEHRTYENQAHQDQLDAATIYQMLEREIIPLYYAKNSKGYSPEWIQYIKNSVTKITPRFTMKRMMDDYFAKFYNKLAKRHNLLIADNCKIAKEIAAWKENMVAHWDEIEVVAVNEPDTSNLNVGDKFTVSVELDTKGLNDKGLGVTFDEKNLLGTIKISRAGEEISQGTLSQSGFYDRVNVGDEVLVKFRPDEKSAEDAQISENAPRAGENGSRILPEDENAEKQKKLDAREMGLIKTPAIIQLIRGLKN